MDELKRKDINEFHVIRSLSILYIIIFHHMDDYVNNYFRTYIGSLDDILTIISLGNLIFISGYLLSQRHEKDLSNQIFSRVIRIYPLYIVSLILFIILGVSSFNTLSVVSHIFCLNMLLKPLTGNPVMTLWFVSLLMTYYCIYWVLWGRNIIHIYVILTLILAILIFLNGHYGLVDKRLILYFPVFFVGSFFGTKSGLFMNIVSNKYYSFATALLLLISALFFMKIQGSGSHSIYVCSESIIFFSIIPFFVFSRCLIRNHFFLKAMLKISFASYCMYLFHRIVFKILIDTFSLSGIYEVILFLFIIGLPLTYLISSIIQKYYDKSVNYLRNYSEHFI
jgi:peptidoglycan/LPS O-acetylase OafA/YrhL